MKLSRKLLLLSVMVVLLVGLMIVPSLAASTPSITIDGTQISIGTGNGTPFIDSANRTQVPIRLVSEKLGATVVWNAASQTATIDGAIKIKLGSTTVTTAYGTTVMDTQAVAKYNRIYVPLKYVANALGYKVEAATKNGVLTANVITKADLTISAAASLKDAMTEIQTLYKEEKPNTTLTVNLGASGTLQQQIEQGAEVDVFFSAASKQMNALKDGGLMIDSSIKNILKNKIVLVVPNDSTLAMDSFKDVTNAAIKTIAIGEPTVVPVGQYAQQVFTYLNIWDAVSAKAVFGQDVKQVLSWVETGNADAGVVYSTDAKTSTKIKVICTASEESHTPIVYPVGVVKATKNDVAAQDFVNFLSSAKAQAVFEKYGFSIY